MLSPTEISDEVQFCSVTLKGLVAWLPLPISCLRNSTATCVVAACHLTRRKVCTNRVCNELMDRRTYERIHTLYGIYMHNHDPGNTGFAVILGTDWHKTVLRPVGLGTATALSITPAWASRASVSLQVRQW